MEKHITKKWISRIILGIIFSPVIVILSPVIVLFFAFEGIKKLFDWAEL